ncbi:hypothetical protein J4573_49410 [Actinomadura barringtoniae]|uniref:Uncharacterized protein n=1 Tax=Actinomadura barringtoniae TaxID=1427535 RepID=A0A939TD33_9ACTN|nr:hypothetical protein [Actinomadura barringtoniae]MBO2455182.1 hypothetical protein [Actinomadura barringtoniae]
MTSRHDAQSAGAERWCRARIAGRLIAVKRLALLACFAPFALAAGILPGTGRQILIRWTTAGLRTLASMVMSALALSVIIMLASAVLSSDADMGESVRDEHDKARRRPLSGMACGSLGRPGTVMVACPAAGGGARADPTS